ncbi:hypothetical protein KKB83_00825 [Patescibacteria group bacterium]|nr:hypothetical protein [Patescibacteria group bacterium]
MDKPYTSFPPIAVSPTIQEMPSSGTTPAQPEKAIKPDKPPYTEYKPITPDNSKFYESKSVKAEKLVFKLR